ncbi:MAG: PAS domain-containing protein [Cyanobacteria bacterium SZAS TMP-1]|nr:PAS domain-containing protein [Cyanobacteria bacterium SZAS TMP-1]
MKTSPLYQLSYTTKIYLLVGLPVCCGLILFLLMSSLVRQLEAARVQETYRNELQLHLNHLVALHFDRQASRIMANMAGGVGAEETAAKLKDSVLAEMNLIDSLVKEHPRERSVWKDIRRLGEEFNEVYNGAVRDYDAGRRANAALQWAKGQTIMKRFYGLIQELSDLQRDESTRQANVIQTYSNYLQAILNLALFFGVLLAFALAWIVSATTTSRFKTVFANAQSLSAGRPPLLQLEGQDELALLNRTYQKLYSALQRMREKDRAVIQNVGDLVLVLDDSLCIGEANKMACHVLERSMDELLAKRVTELLSGAEDVVKTLLAMQDQETAMAAIETGFSGTGGPKILRLNASWVRAERSYFCVAQDITEIKRLEHLRQDLIATVSHDLRSPLTSIQLIHDRLSARINDEEGLRALASAGASTQKLLSLVNNLLDLEKQENELEHLILTAHPLAPILEEVISIVTPLASKKNQTISNQIDRNITVLADRERLYQVLFNLLDNAVKYSPVETHIKVTGQQKGELYQIEVADEGPAIPEDMYGRIFERFGRLALSAAPPEGTGLGLSICKAIVERHGGKIGVKSGKLKGNVFWFTMALVP